MELADRGQVFIIAEAGVNHNGSLDMAKELINCAVKAGADAVKFQTFRSEKITSKFAPKAEYQKQTTGSRESQLDMLKKLELDENAHMVLVDHCKQQGIQFLSTPFDPESVDLLTMKCKVPMLKLPSGEITNAPLLLKMAAAGLPMIVSTGMAYLNEVEDALGVLAFGYTQVASGAKPSREAFRVAYSSQEGQQALQTYVSLLHCTTEYPTPYSDVNLRAMDTLSAAFGLPVGLSDHTEGIAVSIAAVARGACIIEKHFTLDRNLPGPDHKASLDPQQLTDLVQSIRQVSKSLGSGIKSPAPSEIKNMEIARKSIVAARPIHEGELFSEQNLTFKRPGNGISPMKYWDVIGKKATRYIEEDEVIE